MTGFGASFFDRHSLFRMAIDAINPQVATLLIPFFLWRFSLYLKNRPWSGWQNVEHQERMALMVHAMLYATITAVLASGVVMMSKPWKLLGWLPIPVFLHGQPALTAVFLLHESLCVVLLALVGLHLAAVAWHVRRGHPILRRMLIPA
jgi:superoxide oxidase